MEYEACQARQCISSRDTESHACRPLNLIENNTLAKELRRHTIDEPKDRLIGWISALHTLAHIPFPLPRDVFRYIVKLRCSNHKLAIETGRYYGIDRNLRYCGMCNLDVLGDEYHVFFECANPDIVILRQQCIPRYYLQNPSMFKLIQLLKSSDDVKIEKRISMFIKKCKIA